VVTAVLADGTSRDVSASVRPVVTGRSIAVSPAGRVLARADGRSLLRYRSGPAAAQVTVEVSRASAPRPLSYTHDVFPIFSKAGCNQGVCHGNANGKGGFKLSLRGQDPAGDYGVIVRGGGGRRINRPEPGSSLLLLKATAGLPHMGGVRFRTGSEDYHILARWIAEGARSDGDTAPTLAELNVYPSERVLYAAPAPRGRNAGAPVGMAQQLRVTARYGDGAVRDVTTLACYESSDPTIAVTPEGRAVAPGGGEAGINVRYGSLMQTARLTFVPPRPPFVFRPVPVRNYVDRHVLNKLKTVRLQPSDLCDDSTFIRRAYLDVLGFPPTPEEVREFLAEAREPGAVGVPRQPKGAQSLTPPSPSARERLIDRILARPEFNDFWTVKWADLLRAEERSLDPQGMRGLYGWLRESFAQNKPLDQLVRELLTASGNTYDNPATTYFRRTRSPDLLAENTAQLFLGVRLACAKCHNHPYDRWKQTDYHSMAAYFARLTRETKYKPRRQRFDAEEIHGDEWVFPNSTGEWSNPGTGQTIQPAMLGDPSSVPAPDAPDRREALAAWLTRPDNPFFARAMANRVWYHLMGRGIVDPVDDFRDSNPPSNIPLLDALAQDFAAHRFDLRHLVGTIMKSSTYQLSSAPNPLNESDEKYFSRALTPRLTAEQMLEAIGGVTGAPEEFPGYKPGTRVTQVVPTWQPHPFLRLFGQPPRETVCECERNGDATLGQSFELIGGRLIDSRLRAPENRLGRLLQSGKSPREMVDELYLAAYARYPTAEEAKVTVPYLEGAKDRRAALEDLAWGLMNTKEFLLRH
jgi:hypothetical protein